MQFLSPVTISCISGYYSKNAFVFSLPKVWISYKALAKNWCCALCQFFLYLINHLISNKIPFITKTKSRGDFEVNFVRIVITICIHMIKKQTGSEEPDTEKLKKLLDQARDILRLKHYSRRTEESYIAWMKRYIFFHHKRHPRHPHQAGTARPQGRFHHHDLYPCPAAERHQAGAEPPG